MKELANQHKHPVSLLQIDLSIVILSHLANGGLASLDPDASLVLNNVSLPSLRFEFPNKKNASRVVVKLVKNTLDVFWDQSDPKNAREQQLIDNLNSLKKQRVTRAEIVKRVRLHFIRGLNPQKI